MIRNRVGLALLAGIIAATSSARAADEAERSTDLRQGTESTFEQPLEEIFVELSSAAPTGENGRVGNELVFWGHRLSDGRDVFLVACAIVHGVDCAERESRVCVGPQQVLASDTVPGTVRHVRCRNVSIVAPGDIRPGCTDRENSGDLAVSLIQCG